LTSPHYIYFIRAGRTDNVKIGVSRNVKTRLRELQTGNSEPLSVDHVIPYASAYKAYAVEAALHEQFASRRLVGEWFLFTPEALAGALDDLESPVITVTMPPPCPLCPCGCRVQLRPKQAYATDACRKRMARAGNTPPPQENLTPREKLRLYGPGVLTEQDKDILREESYFRAAEGRCGVCGGKATRIYPQGNVVVGVVCTGCFNDIAAGVDHPRIRGFLNSPNVRTALEARQSRESVEFNRRVAVKYGQA
jgi:hypothetical protein